MSERRKHRIGYTALGVALAATLALTACGKEEDASPVGTSATVAEAIQGTATTEAQGTYYGPVHPSVQAACETMMAAYLQDSGVTEYAGAKVFADTDDDGAAMADFNCAVYPGDNTASRKKATVNVFFQQNHLANGKYDATLPDTEYNLKDSGIATFFSTDVELLEDNRERVLRLAENLDKEQPWVALQLCPDGGMPQLFFAGDSNVQNYVSCV